MSCQMFGEVDLNSPGYEYLRSHRSMSSLYLKLVALNYQQDFCSLYKCPSIHRYYFSLPYKKSTEQFFIFTCLCAWLIKDKCQMNLDLSPEDYQDVDTTIGIIIEALKLLLHLDNERDQKSVTNLLNLAPARLKQGFGPEIIWTLSILADRALELSIEAAPGLGRPQIVFHDKLATDIASSTSNSVTIGQPIVGGGLTTRPLGNYQIDDSALMLDNVEANETRQEFVSHFGEAEQWYQQVEKDIPALRTAGGLNEDTDSSSIDWKGQKLAIEGVKKSVHGFLNQSKSLLETIAVRIDKHLQKISGREKFLQVNLQGPLAEFMKDWRDYSKQSTKNEILTEQVRVKTDLFDSFMTHLKSIGSQIETRIKELNDGTKLKELRDIVNSIESENKSLDLRVNLLLMVYGKRRSDAIARAAL